METKKEQFNILLSNLLKLDVEVLDISYQTGGCINKAAILNTTRGKYFVKWNYYKLKKMFEVEIDGLGLLRNSNAFDIPQIIGLIDDHDESFLFLECIESVEGNSNFYFNFAKRLAKLHKITNSSFGLEYDNYIGPLVQENAIKDSWSDFFYENRIVAQLQLAYDSNKLDKSLIRNFESLKEELNSIFPLEKPSLLHGDLWGGNILKDVKGEPVLIDPSVYFGHREMELAYTTLFDNHPNIFYKTYNEYFPLEKGFKDRVDVYNLYPLLVHVNLFGGSYIDQVKEIVQRF